MLRDDLANMLKIRNSRAEDGERVVNIWRDAVDATHDFLSAEDRLAIEAQVKVLLPSAPLWLAVDERDEAIGFMGLSGHHLDSLFIDPNHRGRGIGRRLVNHALSLHPNLTTDVNEQNRQAVGFYESMGFIVIGRSSEDDEGRPYPLIHMKLVTNY